MAATSPTSTTRTQSSSGCGRPGRYTLASCTSFVGYDGPATFHGVPDPGRPHYSVFSFAECDAVYRNEDLWHSAPPDAPRGGGGVGDSMLYMSGDEHRRYRTLVQPSFVPAKAKWWIENWINETVHGLIDGFEADGRAELNVDFDAAIPMLTITGSFGLTIEQALEVRAALEGMPGGRPLEQYIMPIIAARREKPHDDLIGVLCEAEVKDEDGATHRLSDDEIMAFSSLLLAAGSGTTWKQMGITLVALLTTPGVLDEIRADRSLLRLAVEESLRWNVTDPMFSRWATEDTTLGGVDIPAAVSCTSASARPTVTRRGGRTPTPTTSTARCNPRSASPVARTSASACTSPAPSSTPPSARSSTACPICGSTPTRNPRRSSACTSADRRTCPCSGAEASSGRGPGQASASASASASRSAGQAKRTTWAMVAARSLSPPSLASRLAVTRL